MVGLHAQVDLLGKLAKLLNVVAQIHALRVLALIPIERIEINKLGLRGITWHSLRHSHATLLDAVGASLGTVQALLGHSTSEITRELYLHAIPEDQLRAVARVESLVFGRNRTQTDSTLSSAQSSTVVSN